MDDENNETPRRANQGRPSARAHPELSDIRSQTPDIVPKRTQGRFHEGGPVTEVQAHPSRSGDEGGRPISEGAQCMTVDLSSCGDPEFVSTQIGAAGAWESSMFVYPEQSFPPSKHQRKVGDGRIIKLGVQDDGTRGAGSGGVKLKRADMKMMDDKSVSFGLPCAVMFLTLDDDNDETDPETAKSKYLIYLYPESDSSEVFKLTRGMFLTLVDLVQNISGHPLTSTKLVVDDILINAGYYRPDENQKSLLVILLPDSKMCVSGFASLIENIVNFLIFSYGSVQNAFLDPTYHRDLDSIFKILLRKVIVERSFVKGRTLDSLTLLAVGGRFIDIPTELRVVIDKHLVDYQSGVFIDLWLDSDVKRPYNILGSCIFYQTYLLGSHLTEEELYEVCNYCYMSHIYPDEDLIMIRKLNIKPQETIIWTKVYPTRRYPDQNLPCLLLILSTDQMLHCTLLEYGTYCETHANTDTAADMTFVAESRILIQKIISEGVLDYLDKKREQPPNPILLRPDDVMPITRPRRFTSLDRLTNKILHTPPLQRSRDPSPRGREMLPPKPPLVVESRGRTRRRRNSLPTDSLLLDSSSVDNLPDSKQQAVALGSVLGPALRRDPMIMGSEPTALNKQPPQGGGGLLVNNLNRLKLPSDDDIASIGHKDGRISKIQLTDAMQLTVGSHNVLFHYIYTEPFRGVYITPSEWDLETIDGPVLDTVLNNFNRCCLEIQAEFTESIAVINKTSSGTSKTNTQSNNSDNNSSRSSSSYCNEIGVKFRCSFQHQPDAKKPPLHMNYWVVGRLVMLDQTPRELYMCCHESIPQDVTELAFKLSLGISMV